MYFPNSKLRFSIFFFLVGELSEKQTLHFFTSYYFFLTCFIFSLTFSSKIGENTTHIDNLINK